MGWSGGKHLGESGWGRHKSPQRGAVRLRGAGAGQEGSEIGTERWQRDAGCRGNMDSAAARGCGVRGGSAVAGGRRKKRAVGAVRAWG